MKNLNTNAISMSPHMPYLDIAMMKNQISMLHIIRHYGIAHGLRTANDYHLTGCCPIHNGDNPNAFHVDLKRNLFHCFTHCGGGSIFDFVMKKEQLDFYHAALKIWNIFYLAPKQSHVHHKTEKSASSQNIPTLTLQAHHPYLIKRNITPSLARAFQMGYCQFGIMKNRIAIPIFDTQQRIAAYCGRAVDNSQNPRYLFPRNFQKSHHLFNIQTITNGRQPVFMVEGFFDCIHIVRAGLNAVALMGTAISHQQLVLMKQTGRFYILMLDGDEAGRNATTPIEQKLRQYRIPFRTVHLIAVKEPEQLDEFQLRMIAQR